MLIVKWLPNSFYFLTMDFSKFSNYSIKRYRPPWAGNRLLINIGAAI